MKKIIKLFRILKKKSNIWIFTVSNSLVRDWVREKFFLLSDMVEFPLPNAATFSALSIKLAALPYSLSFFFPIMMTCTVKLKDLLTNLEFSVASLAYYRKIDKKFSFLGLRRLLSRPRKRKPFFTNITILYFSIIKSTFIH